MSSIPRTIPALIAFVAVSTGFLVETARAQTVGFVSSEAILERLPESAKARDVLGGKQAEWLNEIATLERKAKELRAEIEINRLLWSPQERQQKQSELRDTEAALDDVRRTKFGPNGEFERLYRDLMTPIVDLVMAAVRAEASEQGYDFVFDKSTRGLPLLVANPDHDLTYAVLTRLGVEVDASELVERESESLIDIPSLGPIKIDADNTIIPSNERADPTERRIDPNEIPMNPE